MENRNELSNKLDGWREAYKEEYELSRLYEKYIYEIYQLKDKIKNSEINNEFLKIYEELENKRREHYTTNRTVERRKKLGYILDHFKK